MDAQAAKNISENISQKIADLSQAIDHLEHDDSQAAKRFRRQLKNTLAHHEADQESYIDYENMAGPNPIIGIHSKDVFDTLSVMLKQALSNPRSIFQQTLRLGGDWLQVLLGNSSLRPDARDHRFQDAAWYDSIFFRRLMQGYFAWHHRLHEWIEESDLTECDRRRATFILSILTEACSPTNTLLNPEALKRCVETSGVSLVQGARHFVHDWLHNGGLPSQVNMKAFCVGENIAVSPGAVVFRNELLELLQYQPTTTEVWQRPLFLIPPQINKYYIFDLIPEKSFIQHATQQGMQVFVCSWRNPKIEQRDWGLENYVVALEDALDAVIEITGSHDVNVMGACSGGITAATLLGYLAAANKSKVNSFTLMVSVLDLNIDNDAALFATDRSLAQAKSYSHRRGVLEGKDLARVFAWMRPNDLIWHYWVNNYLLGYEPPANEVLYWNNDTTRLPAELHGEFIEMYEENPLHKPGLLKICHQPIDLKQVTVDTYIMAGMTDHITPWEACYRSSHLFGGKCQFVLSNSGHIQSILNPPDNKKSYYFLNHEHPKTAKEWKLGAHRIGGSWWVHWIDWISQRSAEKVPAPQQLGSASYPALDIAPGTYVHE
ncbi:alpha/beta fold hydrolase [Zooshikella ganghwensis]|uniref:alpha/beta fold hydrolase n=1 Tax=Zooshikella ganghwensis TaxID=202772 RepID=UPI00040B44E7|nr:alpha/beta fold hydrolase [Zooshikella ganghwensis]